MSLRGALFDDAGGGGELARARYAQRHGGAYMVRRAMLDAALGDVLCWRWEQRAAEDAVAGMNAVFKSLGSPASWSSAVDSINTEWANIDHWYRDWTLCGSKSIGARAQQLTKNMQIAAGQQPAPDDPNLQPGPTERLGGIATIVTGVAVVAGVSLLVGAVRDARKGK